MTKRDMIAAIVDDQIRRGMIKPESRDLQIQSRLHGIGQAKPMSLKQCERAYKGYFNL